MDNDSEIDKCYEICYEFAERLKLFGFNVKKRKVFRTTCRQKCRSAGVPKIFVYPDELSF